MQYHVNDIIHAIVVVIVIVTATVYAVATTDHSGNVWIVYGSAIGYAAGRAGPALTRTLRSTDPGG